MPTTDDSGKPLPYLSPADAATQQGLFREARAEHDAELARQNARRKPRLPSFQQAAAMFETPIPTVPTARPPTAPSSTMENVVGAFYSSIPGNAARALQHITPERFRSPYIGAYDELAAKQPTTTGGKIVRGAVGLLPDLPIYAATGGMAAGALPSGLAATAAGRLLARSAVGAASFGVAGASREATRQAAAPGPMQPGSIAKAGVKEAAVGAALGPAGGISSPFVRLPAEVGSLTAAGAAVERRAPTADELAVNMALVGMLHASGAVVDRTNMAQARAFVKTVKSFNDIRNIRNAGAAVVRDNPQLAQGFLTMVDGAKSGKMPEMVRLVDQFVPDALKKAHDAAINSGRAAARLGDQAGVDRAAAEQASVEAQIRDHVDQVESDFKAAMDQAARRKAPAAPEAPSTFVPTGGGEGFNVVDRRGAPEPEAQPQLGQRGRFPTGGDALANQLLSDRQALEQELQSGTAPPGRVREIASRMKEMGAKLDQLGVPREEWSRPAAGPGMILGPGDEAAGPRPPAPEAGREPLFPDLLDASGQPIPQESPDRGFVPETETRAGAFAKSASDRIWAAMEAQDRANRAEDQGVAATGRESARLGALEAPPAPRRAAQAETTRRMEGALLGAPRSERDLEGHLTKLHEQATKDLGPEKADEVVARLWARSRTGGLASRLAGDEPMRTGGIGRTAARHVLRRMGFTNNAIREMSTAEVADRVQQMKGPGGPRKPPRPPGPEAPGLPPEPRKPGPPTPPPGGAAVPVLRPQETEPRQPVQAVAAPAGPEGKAGTEVPELEPEEPVPTKPISKKERARREADDHAEIKAEATRYSDALERVKKLKPTQEAMDELGEDRASIGIEDAFDELIGRAGEIQEAAKTLREGQRDGRTLTRKQLEELHDTSVDSEGTLTDSLDQLEDVYGFDGRMAIEKAISHVLGKFPTTPARHEVKFPEEAKKPESPKKAKAPTKTAAASTKYPAPSRGKRIQTPVTGEVMPGKTPFHNEKIVVVPDEQYEQEGYTYGSPEYRQTISGVYSADLMATGAKKPSTRGAFQYNGDWYVSMGRSSGKDLDYSSAYRIVPLDSAEGKAVPQKYQAYKGEGGFSYEGLQFDWGGEKWVVTGDAVAFTPRSKYEGLKRENERIAAEEVPSVKGQEPAAPVTGHTPNAAVTPGAAAAPPLTSKERAALAAKGWTRKQIENMSPIAGRSTLGVKQHDAPPSGTKINKVDEHYTKQVPEGWEAARNKEGGLRLGDDERIKGTAFQENRDSRTHELKTVEVETPGGRTVNMIVQRKLETPKPEDKPYVPPTPRKVEPAPITQPRAPIKVEPPETKPEQDKATATKTDPLAALAKGGGRNPGLKVPAALTKAIAAMSNELREVVLTGIDTPLDIAMSITRRGSGLKAHEWDALVATGGLERKTPKDSEPHYHIKPGSKLAQQLYHDWRVTSDAEKGPVPFDSEARDARPKVKDVTSDNDRRYGMVSDDGRQYTTDVNGKPWYTNGYWAIEVPDKLPKFMAKARFEPTPEGKNYPKIEAIIPKQVKASRISFQPIGYEHAKGTPTRIMEASREMIGYDAGADSRVVTANDGYMNAIEAMHPGGEWAAYPEKLEPRKDGKTYRTTREAPLVYEVNGKIKAVLMPVSVPEGYSVDLVRRGVAESYEAGGRAMSDEPPKPGSVGAAARRSFKDPVEAQIEEERAEARKTREARRAAYGGGTTEAEVGRALDKGAVESMRRQIAARRLSGDVAGARNMADKLAAMQRAARAETAPPKPPIEPKVPKTYTSKLAESAVQVPKEGMDLSLMERQVLSRDGRQLNEVVDRTLGEQNISQEKYDALDQEQKIVHVLRRVGAARDLKHLVNILQSSKFKAYNFAKEDFESILNRMAGRVSADGMTGLPKSLDTAVKRIETDVPGVYSGEGLATKGKPERVFFLAPARVILDKIGLLDDARLAQEGMKRERAHLNDALTNAVFVNEAGKTMKRGSADSRVIFQLINNAEGDPAWLKRDQVTLADGTKVTPSDWHRERARIIVDLLDDLADRQGLKKESRRQFYITHLTDRIFNFEKATAKDITKIHAAAKEALGNGYDQGAVGRMLSRDMTRAKALQLLDALGGKKPPKSLKALKATVERIEGADDTWGIPDSVYQPFLKLRKGGAYAEDAMAAVEAYVTYALRKIHMEPLVERWKPIVEAMGGAGHTGRLANLYMGTRRQYAEEYFSQLLGRPYSADKLADGLMEHIALKTGGKPLKIPVPRWLFRPRLASRAAGLVTRLQYIRLLGLAFDSGVTNMTQSLNTVARAGLFNTAKGGIRLLDPRTWSALKDARIMDEFDPFFGGVESYLKHNLSRVEKVIMSPFGLAERFNRGLAFSVGMEMGKRAGLSNAESVQLGLAKSNAWLERLQPEQYEHTRYSSELKEFARRFVIDTQFGYSPAEASPVLGRPGARVGMQFWNYPLQQSAGFFYDNIWRAGKAGEYARAFRSTLLLGWTAFAAQYVMAQLGMDVKNIWSLGSILPRNLGPNATLALDLLAAMGGSEDAQRNLPKELMPRMVQKYMNPKVKGVYTVLPYRPTDTSMPRRIRRQSRRQALAQ